MPRASAVLTLKLTVPTTVHLIGTLLLRQLALGNTLSRKFLLKYFYFCVSKLLISNCIYLKDMIWKTYLIVVSDKNV